MAAPIKETLEREAKLTADAVFELPDLPGDPIEPRVFTSTYYDTPDHRLAAAGVTLRRRVENRRGLWQLKLPRESARLELELPGGPSEPPQRLRELLTAHCRGRELAPVAKLRTRRAGVRARDGDKALAEVVVDSVTALEGRRVSGRFTELEVELLDGDAKSLRQLTKLLRLAGAKESDGRPKLFQVLGLDYPVGVPTPRRGAPAGEHLQAMLRAQYVAIVAHDPGTRLGADPEELHQHRVATRRLRALLRAARPLVDPEWAESLRAELAWLGGALGPVRDADVFLEHLRGEAAALEPREQRALVRALERLEVEHAEARAAMLEALSSARYLELLDRLEAGTSSPPVLSPDESLRTIAAAEFKKLRRAVRRLPEDAPDEALHEARIRGKRARYAAELAEGAVGNQASRFIKEAKTFQDVLGEHQDAAVAEERIRELLGRSRGGRATFVAGRLVERQRARRAAARAAFPAVWARLEKQGRKAWS